MHKQLVWYVGYGSNLLKERFLCYIQGGCPPKSGFKNPGCRDKTLPLKDEPCTLGHGIYFASEADVWGKSAACFMDSDTGGFAYGRRYLITEEQLSDIVIQENAVNVVSIELDFEDAIKNKLSEIKSDVELPFYTHLLYLGEHDGYPMFTFTQYPKVTDFSEPSPAYLKAISDGLRQAHGLSDEQIRNYLGNRL